MQFRFAGAGQIIFGTGSLSLVASEAIRSGTRMLLVTGGNRQRAQALQMQLQAAGVTSLTHYMVEGEPEVEDITRAVELARREGCDCVIGFGGGSVIDSAKAVAALCTNPQPIDQYLEIIGQGQPLGKKSLPCIAVPTTAGTGSEVTRNAVLRSRRHGIKISLRGDGMFPVLAVIDPATMISMPPNITAWTGCDALCQLLEAFVSRKANPMTDALCREALPRASAYLRKAFSDGGDVQARAQMALAALFSGLALTNGGLGAVHGIAGPLGGMIDAPHGALCARLLPFVVEANLKSVAGLPQENACVRRFNRLAVFLTGSEKACAADVIKWLHDLIKDLKIPNLAFWGLEPGMIPELTAKAQKASSMQGNPVSLAGNELQAIIERAMR